MWDARGRLAQVQFPDASPDITLGYDPGSRPCGRVRGRLHGNLTSAARGATHWAYQYDALDALTAETLAIDGLSFPTGYTRNANGFVTHQTTPGGRTLNYLPDGFGRPTRVRTGGVNYASGASYHVSGGLSTLNYANDRQLSASSTGSTTAPNSR